MIRKILMVIVTLIFVVNLSFASRNLKNNQISVFNNNPFDFVQTDPNQKNKQVINSNDEYVFDEDSSWCHRDSCNLEFYKKNDDNGLGDYIYSVNIEAKHEGGSVHPVNAVTYYHIKHFIKDGDNENIIYESDTYKKKISDKFNLNFPPILCGIGAKVKCLKPDNL